MKKIRTIPVSHIVGWIIVAILYLNILTGCSAIDSRVQIVQAEQATRLRIVREQTDKTLDVFRTKAYAMLTNFRIELKNLQLEHYPISEQEEITRGYLDDISSIDQLNKDIQTFQNWLRQQFQSLIRQNEVMEEAIIGTDNLSPDRKFVKRLREQATKKPLFIKVLPGDVLLPRSCEIDDRVRALLRPANERIGTNEFIRKYSSRS